MSTSTMNKNQSAESLHGACGDTCDDLKSKAAAAQAVVSEKAQQFKEAFRENASEAIDNLKHVGADVSQRACDGLESLRDNAGDYMELGRAKAQDLGAAVERQIRTQPLTSILVAVGVGFLVGAIWSRR